jgi:hypothetical protein
MYQSVATEDWRSFQSCRQNKCCKMEQRRIQTSWPQIWRTDIHWRDLHKSNPPTERYRSGICWCPTATRFRRSAPGAAARPARPASTTSTTSTNYPTWPWSAPTARSSSATGPTSERTARPRTRNRFVFLSICSYSSSCGSDTSYATTSSVFCKFSSASKIWKARKTGCSTWPTNGRCVIPKPSIPLADPTRGSRTTRPERW